MTTPVAQARRCRPWDDGGRWSRRGQFNGAATTITCVPEHSATILMVPGSGDADGIGHGAPAMAGGSRTQAALDAITLAETAQVLVMVTA